VIAWVAWFIIVTVFALGAWQSMLAPDRLEGVLTGLGLPAWLAPAAAAVELAVLATLIASPARGAVGAVAYLIVVTSTLGIARFRGHLIEDCACFARPRPVDGAFFIRNLILITLAITVVRYGAIGSLLIAAVLGIVALLFGFAVTSRRARQPRSLIAE